jgi:excisionase family DNA binding protein
MSMADLPPLERAAVVTVPALLSVATVAEVLDCSPRTVRRRIDAHDLPAVLDHGRLMVRGDELRAYIEALDRPSTPGRQRTRSTAGRFDFLRQ